MADKLTDEEYVASEGCICPFCRGNNVESFGTPIFDSDYMTRPVECTDCDETWQDVYTLTGWTTS